MVDVAQAVTTSRQGPLARKRMAICPAAMFDIIVGTMSGETQRPVGSSIILAVSRYWVSKPPIPEPTYTPSLKGSMLALLSSVCSPESSTACIAAAMPYWTNLSCLRTNPLSRPAFSPSKSLTIPAILTGRPSVGKSVMKPIPFTPLTSESQKVFTSFPTGEMTPMPVTTTLCSIACVF